LEQQQKDDIYYLLDTHTHRDAHKTRQKFDNYNNKNKNRI